MKPVPIEIVYEDNHLLVVVKPVNIPVQSDSSGDADLLNLLKADLKIRHQKPGNVFLGLVHRLDRPVGGVMVFAKTSKAAARLGEQVQNRSFQKTYFAVIHGLPRQSSGTLIHYLLKENENNLVKAVSKTQPGAKEAVLEYESIAVQEQLTLVRIQLHTGRSHQIRVQFAEIGNPLYGDQKYGSAVNKPGQQIALWATRVEFAHPTKDETMCFTVPLPSEYPWSMFGDRHEAED